MRGELRRTKCFHLRLVDVDPGSMVVEAAVERPVVMEETLEIQRDFFTFGRSFLTGHDSPFSPPDVISDENLHY